MKDFFNNDKVFLYYLLKYEIMVFFKNVHLVIIDKIVVKLMQYENIIYLGFKTFTDHGKEV